ncbi:Flagellar basal body-associated protein FliL [Aquimixticola soesokkakensis]|uniref:Flagellar protein FliL n=1 Tax=Aquimixticola soesokkakensis TaxID=1519096 RepID=A0A1Y5RDH4_9RHOB|nr:flagellar basal body-associated FliL family protein [Aquimixticola soesokkakensis]SLN12375.1 Flagellar basal body-associated protein FliL [Aquimixticola soesokkakensis]
MLGKILPILLAIVGLGAGIGGGIALRPAPQPVVLNPCGDLEMHDVPADTQAPEEDTEDPQFEYVKLNNQFVIPDVDNGKVVSMVVLSLSLEVTVGSREAIYAMEPKLRDAFLQVFFDHANLGGFKGDFTESTNMDKLRKTLLEVGQKLGGKAVNDVLLTDIVRQDMG